MPEENTKINATDSAAKLAAANDIDLTGVVGSGEGGRILKADVDVVVAAKSTIEEKTTSEPVPDTVTEEEVTPADSEPVSEDTDGATPGHGAQNRVTVARMDDKSGFSKKDHIVYPK